LLPYGKMVMLTDSIQLGATVKARRKELRATQAELAMTAGTGVRFIVDLENGKPTCQVGKVLKVLQTLGLVIEIKAR